MIMTGVMILFIAAFLLVMGLIMMDDIMVDTATDAVTVSNETLTTVTEAGEYVTAISTCGFNGFTVLYMTNASGTAYDIAATNYTVGGEREGLITYSGAVNDGYNNTDWNISYTYNYGNSAACDSINNTITGQGSFADYFDLIVLAIVITVIISLMLIGFALRRTK